MGVEIFHALKSVLAAQKKSTAWATRAVSRRICATNEEALDVILEAIEKAGYRAGEEIVLALDVRRLASCIATALRLPARRRRAAQRGGDGRVLSRLVRASTRSSRIEDALAENDWDGWKQLTDALGERVQLVGDDLFVTNTERLRRASSRASATRS